MVEICRWPKALYRAASICCGVMPSRLAVSRSIASFTCSPSFDWSLATSRSCGIALSFSSIFPTQKPNSLGSGDSMLYWNCVRLTRSSTVRSCTGCMNSVIPSTFASLAWSRRITSPASILRCSIGTRLIWMRPLLRVVLVPSTPMNDERLSTAGSCKISRANSCCLADMELKEIVSGASEMPRITPVSCTGKKPLGTMTYSQIVATSVATATSSVVNWWRRMNRSVVP